MADDVHLWRVGAGDQLAEIHASELDMESRLQEWLAQDISILDPDLLVIGREVPTAFGGFIDILCMDANGDLVVVELKRDRTPREITAQTLDYASWVVELSNERVTELAERHLRGGDLETTFRARFDSDLPETLNGDHRMLIVGSAIDAGSERIIKYLSETHGVNINAATFQYFREADGSELLARVFLIKPSDVDLHTRTKRTSKRRANLSSAELSALASDNGVEELYEYAVTVFERLLQRPRTTRSSIGFHGSFSGSRKVIVSLVPGDSRTGMLRYQLYSNRYAELTGLSAEDVEELLPANRELTAGILHRRREEADPDWEVFEGFIVSREEIDRIAKALSHGDSKDMGLRSESASKLASE